MISLWEGFVNCREAGFPPLGPRRRAYQVPVFGMLAQGSAGGLASPICKSSTEIPSGLFTKAMRPSRGGRLIVTPPFCSLSQIA